MTLTIRYQEWDPKPFFNSKIIKQNFNRQLVFENTSVGVEQEIVNLT